MVLKLQATECLEGWLKYRLLGPIPESLIQQVWDEVQEFAFPTISQGITDTTLCDVHQKVPCNSVLAKTRNKWDAWVAQWLTIYLQLRA